MVVKYRNRTKATVVVLLVLLGAAASVWHLVSGEPGAIREPRPPSGGSEGTSRGPAAVVRTAEPSVLGDAATGPVRGPIPALTPYALSPGKLSLGDTVQDVLARSDGPQALRLGRILSACATIDGRERRLELRRTYPTGDSEFDRTSLKEESDQLNRIKSECQTLQGNPKDVIVTLAELAVSQQVPGAVQMLLSLRPGRQTSALLERLVEDARGGEWLSVMSASGGRMVPDAERAEMLLAVRQTLADTKAYGTEFDLVYRTLLAKVWSTPSSGGQSAMTVPRGKEIWHAGTIDLPPEVQKPTDPQALARIERLTALLTRQVREMQAEREDARRRAAGG